MPRNKKFDKRGGGRRLDAESAEEIEIRNKRLEEFEAARQARRSEEDEEGDEEGGEKEEVAEDDATPTAGTAAKPKAPAPAAPVQQTTQEEHNRNLAKLEAVRRRREVAEAKRKIEQEAELALEMEHKARVEALEEDGVDSDEEEVDDGKKKKKKSKEKNIPKLTKIEIKKLKPAQMKEGTYFMLKTNGENRKAFLDLISCIFLNHCCHFSCPRPALKERGLDIQGNAKALMARLVSYEESR
jgi:hypothetical protein